jgi:hypothetical protein
VAGVSIHALTVSDNPKKFAIAVTRARVDSPSFLVVIPSCCALYASPGCAAVLEAKSKPNARVPKFNRIRSLRGLEPSTPNKVYALCVNFPCRI